MRKKVNGKRVGSKITLFVSAVFFLAVSFYSCQKDEMILGSENIELKSSAISEIVTNQPLKLRFLLKYMVINNYDCHIGI
jgi:hypothetical protein